MFKQVKEYFKNRNPFHRKIVLSTLLSDNNEILLDDLLFLISCFENNNSDFVIKSPSHYIEQYFQLALQYKLFHYKQLTREFTKVYHIRSKILLTTHLMLHEFQLGLEFAEIFLYQKYDFLTVKYSNQQENWLTQNVQLPYFQYLQRLGVNIQVFHACKVQQYPLIEESQKFIDVQTKLIWLFKISNLANSCLGQMEIIKSALVSNQNDLLLKEIVLVYWSDLLVYYNFLSKEVIKMIIQSQNQILQLLDYYKHLASNICLQFYELYLQLFQIRNTITDLYKYKQHFDRDNVIKQPKWFDINKPIQKEVEDYIIQQRLEHLNYRKGGMTDRNVTGKKSLNEMLKLNLKQIKSNQVEIKEKNIQTHRASRRKGSDADDEDFEELKKILQSQNIQKRLADKKQEQTQPSSKTQAEDEVNKNKMQQSEY